MSEPSARGTGPPAPQGHPYARLTVALAACRTASNATYPYPLDTGEGVALRAKLKPVRQQRFSMVILPGTSRSKGRWTLFDDEMRAAVRENYELAYEVHGNLFFSPKGAVGD